MLVKKNLKPEMFVKNLVSGRTAVVMGDTAHPSRLAPADRRSIRVYYHDLGGRRRRSFWRLRNVEWRWPAE